MDSLIKDLAQSSNIKILGICLGMQMLRDSSEEGVTAGLRLIPGKTRKFTKDVLSDLKIPHMGWNHVIPKRESILFPQDFDSDKNAQRFYFAHGYWFDCENKDNIVAVTPYGCYFSSVIWNGDNVYGVQFHPEKSHHFGMGLLNRFAIC